MLMREHTMSGCATALFVALVLVSAASAQLSDQKRTGSWRQAQSQPTSDETSQPTTTSTSTSTSTSTTSAEVEEAEEKPKWFAIVNGRVHTVTGPTLTNTTVLCKDGVIAAIGEDLRLPDECDVLDASGREVYPGLIATAAGGIHGGGDPRDTTNVFGLNMRVALAGGITTAIAGNDAAKLTYGTLDGLLLRRKLFVNLALSTRKPLDAANMRADFERVRDYLRDYARWQIDKQDDEDAQEPDKSWLKGKYENYRKLMTGQATAIATANTVGGMRPLLELARHFGFKLVLRGAAEGWIIPDELGRAGVMAIVTPRTSRQPDKRYNRTTGSSIENARILSEHGVTVAVVPATSFITLWGLAGRDLLHLNMEAAFAVRGGMTNAEALRTITIDAARVLGVDDRVGSIEVGKDADMIVTDGPILHYMTQVHQTVVNGRIAYDKAESTLYAHIRPDGEPTAVEFDDQWPRRLEWSQADLQATAPQAPVEAEPAETSAEKNDH